MTYLSEQITLKKEVGELFCNAFIEIKKDEAKRLADKTIDEIREFYLPFV